MAVHGDPDGVFDIVELPPELVVNTTPLRWRKWPRFTFVMKLVDGPWVLGATLSRALERFPVWTTPTSEPGVPYRLVLGDQSGPEGNFEVDPDVIYAPVPKALLVCVFRPSFDDLETLREAEVGPNAIGSIGWTFTSGIGDPIKQAIMAPIALMHGGVDPPGLKAIVDSRLRQLDTNDQPTFDLYGRRQPEGTPGNLGKSWAPIGDYLMEAFPDLVGVRRGPSGKWDDWQGFRTP